MGTTGIGLELRSWARRHWFHILISPVAFFLYTVVHECAHAFAAAAQGATITEFSVIPNGESLGYMNYQFSEGSYGDRDLVSIAPYVLWSLCMIGVVLLSTRKRGYSFPLASTLFLWGFLGAWGDIALAGMSWVNAGRGDWGHVLGESTPIDALAMSLAWVCVLALGYLVQRRLYRSAALSKASYAIMVFAGGCALWLGTSVIG